MSDFARLVPVIVAAGLAAGGQDEIKELYDTSVDMAWVVVARVEVAGITTVVTTQAAADNLPRDLEYGFAAFINEHLHKPDGSDASHDPWGDPYRFRATAEAYEVRSSGPDGVWESDDDLVSTIPRK